MLKGKCLTSNSTIGIISPASPEDKKIIDTKCSFLSSLGFKVKLGKHIYDRYGHLAGSDEARAEDIMTMFLDDNVDGIICFRGGYGCIRTLSYLDPTLIIQHPKFFCGYSDITLLLNYLSSIGLITFHGPMVNSKLNDSTTLNSFYNISTCSDLSYIYDFSNLTTFSSINCKSFSGKIVGGNLAMICSAIGTPYDIDMDNSILLLEEVNEPPYAIDRMLTQLIISNKLSKCNGIVLGHFTDCNLENYDRSLTIDEVILDRLKPLNIPLLKGIPFGHDYPNITLPIGCNASFNCKTLEFKILEQMLL